MYTHLRVFGCLCFATNNSHKTKFDDWTVKGVFIGYSHQKKGYEVLNLKTNGIFFNRDVSFVETKFSFSAPNIDEPQHLQGGTTTSTYDN